MYAHYIQSEKDTELLKRRQNIKMDANNVTRAKRNPNITPNKQNIFVYLWYIFKLMRTYTCTIKYIKYKRFYTKIMIKRQTNRNEESTFILCAGLVLNRET